MVVVFITLKPKLIQPFLLTWKCRRDELFISLKSILPNMCKNKLGFPPETGCGLEIEALPTESTDPCPRPRPHPEGQGVGGGRGGELP